MRISGYARALKKTEIVIKPREPVDKVSSELMACLKEIWEAFGDGESNFATACLLLIVCHRRGLYSTA